MAYIWIRESAGSMRYVDAKYLPPCNICGKQLDECSKHEKEKENGEDVIATRGADNESDNN